MEKMNLSEAQVFRFVKEGLLLIGFPNNIDICSYVGDGEKPMYYATYEKEVNGKVDKHIKPLRVRDFVDLMNFAMSVNGYDIDGIDIRVRDDEICYSVRVNIATYGDGPKMNKRRR